MEYNKFISFLKRHNLYDQEIFNYFWDEAIFFDYRDEWKRSFIGCFYLFDNVHHLKKMRVFVPFINDDITILINIHEYVHLFMLYRKLGKRVKIGDDVEILAMYYERIYLLENPTQELSEYLMYLNQCIDLDKDLKYTIGLNVCEELLNSCYNYNITKLYRKTKKLIKKYHRKG